MKVQSGSLEERCISMQRQIKLLIQENEELREVNRVLNKQKFQLNAEIFTAEDEIRNISDS